MKADDLLNDIYAEVGNIDNYRQKLLDFGIESTSLNDHLLEIYNHTKETINALFEKADASDVLKNQLNTCSHQGIINDNFQLLIAKIEYLGVDKFQVYYDEFKIQDEQLKTLILKMNELENL